MEALTSIGDFLGSTAGKAITGLGTAGAGLVQNLQAYRKQKQVQDLISDPKKFNAMVAATEKPLSAGLTADVGRQTDAYGAERGLGSSPYIMKDVYAQALAPFYLQQQQAAQNSVLERLGLMARNPVQPIDVSSIFKALSMGGTNKPDVTSGIDLSTIPDPSSNYNWFTPGALTSPPVDVGSTDLFSGGGGTSFSG